MTALTIFVESRIIECNRCFVRFIAKECAIFLVSSSRPYHLTSAEECVLRILWQSSEALTQQQIVDTAKETGVLTWKPRSIFSLLNGLMAKGLVESESFVRSGKTFARTFRATVTRPEYYAKMVKSALTEEEMVVFKKALEPSLDGTN